jgi:hypothetical protein
MARGGKNSHVTARESNAMFAYWCDGENGRLREISDLARKFNRSRDTIYRVRRLFGWDERLKKIVTKTEAKTNQGLAKAKATTREILEGAFIKMAKAILDPGVVLTSEYTMTCLPELVSKLTALGRVLLEVEGKVPKEPGLGDTYNVNTVIYQGLSEEKRKEIDEERKRVDGEYDGILQRLAEKGRFDPSRN